jgi:hypothetical protein
MDEEKKLILSLPIKDWNRIRNSLGKEPYKDVADLFTEMNIQFDKQLKPNSSENNEQNQQE